MGIWRCDIYNIYSGVMPFAATQIILEIITLSEISQIEKDKNDISYIWNLKKLYKWIYLQNRTRDRKQT